MSNTVSTSIFMSYLEYISNVNNCTHKSLNVLGKKSSIFLIHILYNIKWEWSYLILKD